MLKDDDDLKKFLTEIDSLLDSVDKTTTRSDFSTEQESFTPEQIRQTVEDVLEGEPEPAMDGFADLFIAEDGMKVTADFFPPVGAGLPLTLEAFQNQLESQKVVWGVNWPFIKAALRDCNLDLKPQRGVVVAQGLLPEDQLSERWEILPVLREKRQVLDREGTFLDFKVITPFVMVKKGDLLAEILPPRDGNFGSDVFGNALTFSKKPPLVLQPGDNVYRERDGFRASCDGILEYDALMFKVSRVLVVDQVSYTTGHVDFAGDVVIKGEIAPGFKIKAQGDVFCSQVMDVSEIQCSGDVVTPFGIIGRQGAGALIKCEGRVRAKFLENVYILAKKTVEIRSSVMNSLVQTGERLIMGDRSVLVGGKVQAQKGLDVYQIGSERGAKAEIVCGIDFTVMDKIVWLRDQNIELVRKLKTLELEKTRFPVKAQALQAVTEKIRAKILELNELSGNLLGKVDKNEDSEIRVRGTIFPGNYLEICHMSYMVAKPMSRVKFFLDKKKGQIGFVPLA